MINNIKQAIVNKLIELYPGFTIYDEDVPQNFKTQSFLITLIEQDYNKRMNVKYKSLLTFDIAYYSDRGIAETKSDCQRVQLGLLRGFDIIGTFRVLNKQATIIDNVLHVTFDIISSEIKTDVGVPMQTQQTNTNL